MIENRKSPRHKVFKAATIEFNRAGGISCIVRNVSDGGACLEVASPFGIPADFSLHIVGSTGGHKCHVVWRTEKRIGVAFTDAVEQPAAA
jgi:PilZ domain-containing protein